MSDTVSRTEAVLDSTANQSEQSAHGASGRGMALAAALIMLGNLASRIFGQIRESLIASHFSIAEIELYAILSAIPIQIYDFLVGGLVSAALVPVLSDYIDADEKPALWRLLSTMLMLVVGALALIGGVTWVLAPGITRLLATNITTDPATAQLATEMLRIMTGAVLFMGISGLLTGILQAQRRFLLPAFTTSVFNIGMILVIVLAPGDDVRLLAYGMLAGACGQMLLQTPGLRGVRLRPALDLRHPGVRRIGRLYLPVAIGIGFSVIGTVIDRKLADELGGGAAAYMRVATSLVQLTLGLIAAAVSLAILPTLSRLSSSDDQDSFRRVLGTGLKVITMLIVPATIGLAILGTPIIRLLYEHGKFSPADTQITTLVLLVYLPSMLATAIDQPLIFAFYARKNTLLPNLVQGAAIASYLAVAFTTYRIWGMYGLVLANVAQWVAHAILMAWLAHRQIGIFRNQQLGLAAGKITLAGAAMALVCWGVDRVLPTAGHGGALLTLAVSGGAGLVVYGILLWRLKLDALQFFKDAVARKLGRAA